MKIKIQDILNTVVNDDTLKTLKRMPSGSVDMCITSPPYYNLRDYETDGQIGNEETLEDYLDNLMDIFMELYRVLKNEGVFWLNIADTYASKNEGKVKRKSQMGVPERLKIRMIDSGWICRSNLVWRKPNAMPSSAKDRFTNDYEELFMFTKQESYFFETQYEERLTEAPTSKEKTSKNLGKYKSVEQESSVRQGMNKERGEGLVEKRDLPSHLDFVDKLRKKYTRKELYEVSDLKPSTIDHWFRKDTSGFSYPKAEDWKRVVDHFNEDIFPELTDIYHESDCVNKNAHKGRIMRTVWDINTKPFKGCHFAPFPNELVRTPILATCPKGGIAMDIFMGSGTVGEEVVKLGGNRRFIGIELNKEYVEIAKKRVENAQASR